MDRLSLALTLLGWVVIALLSFFVGVVILRALRHLTVVTRWMIQRDKLNKSSNTTNRHG
jgi:hypothetical protein